MKSIYIAAAIGALIASVSAVDAQCVCDPTESACLSDCVSRTNSCISECQSNNDCYESCISMHWPGANPSYSESMIMPSSIGMMSDSNSWYATPTSTWSSSMWSQQYTSSSSWNSYATPTWSSQWPQSSGYPSGWPPNPAWPSGATWSHSGSMVPGASATIIPSGTSAATSIKASSVVLGLGLACAAYLLQ